MYRENLLRLLKEMQNNNSNMDDVTPMQFHLSQNYPNPFKEKTVIKYCVAYKTRVKLTIYNSEGEEIEKLVDEVKNPGTYEVEFSACHSRESGNLPDGRQGLPDGYYFYRMTAGDYSSEKKWLCINKLSGRFNMKSLLQTLFFFLLTTQICFGQWTQVGLNGETIKDIAVQNQNIFAVTSDGGKVYRSLDNGINWTMIVDSCAVDVAISLTGKIFMTQDSILNIPPPFDRTFLLSSLDNGDTWTPVNMIEQIKDSLPYWWLCRPINITVSPAGVIFCYIKDRGRDEFDCFAKSTDDGVSWTTCGQSLIGGKLFDFKDQFVITVGEISGVGAYGNAVHLSSDYGNTWTNLGGVETGDFHALGFFSNYNIIVGGSYSYGPNLFKGALYISTDMCSTWTIIDTLINSQVGLSYLIGSTEGMIIGTKELGVFLFSDEGDSLGLRNEGLTNLNVQAHTLDNNGYVYAGTENGVWRRPLIEIISSVYNEPTQTTEFILEQNYPNPFNPSTVISYQLPVSSEITLKVFDALGNAIATLVDEYKPAGKYEVEFTASKLPSGVYFYQLKAGEFLQTRKMILLK